ncbi:hypothetical protein [Algoriphagus confluentis]|uniref:Lipocalin-like domain-containing protein n=1 Tax=Algoriphagus confluentis TaxID=1697556 RepID=A0ABQ6PL71_9BACT|nr:hypothetical protein Aconfl_13670 [Algoriphagus confluentis]
MKSSSFFFSFVLFLILFGCQESEEPLQPLMSGTWEHRVYDESLELWMVEVLTFQNDSVMEVQKIVRQTETGETLGYRMLTTSWYNLEENIFKYYYSDALIYFGGGSDSDSPPYGTKDDLRPGIVDFFRLPTGTLTFSANRNRFVYQEDCWRIGTAEDCLPFPAREYVRVN